MLRQPNSFASRSATSTLLRGMLVHVRCIHVSTPKYACTVLTRYVVQSDVRPPAFHVMSTNSGPRCDMRSMRSSKLSMPCAVRGGKYSKLHLRSVPPPLHVPGTPFRLGARKLGRDCVRAPITCYALLLSSSPMVVPDWLRLEEYAASPSHVCILGRRRHPTPIPPHARRSHGSRRDAAAGAAAGTAVAPVLHAQ